MPKKNQLDSSSHFDTIPACDRRTDGQTDGHTETSYAALAKRRAVKIILGFKDPTDTKTCLAGRNLRRV